MERTKETPQSRPDTFGLALDITRNEQRGNMTAAYLSGLHAQALLASERLTPEERFALCQATRDFSPFNFE